MKQSIEIEALNRDAVVERILRVIRHRGFRLQQMRLNTSVDSSNCHLSVTVESDRPLQLLLNQLKKLVDVQAVELECEDSNTLKISA